MTEWNYEIKPRHRMKNEPLWYNILSEWSASAPSTRVFRKHNHGDMTMWFREIWHEVNAKDRRIEELEAALKDAIEMLGGDV